MILADTSVWIEHLRHGERALVQMLETSAVLTHPFVIGELALGSLRQRETVLGALQNLPKAQSATDDEVLKFIARYKLFGLGVGYVDAHLLAAVKLTPDTTLWTFDKRLHTAAVKLALV